MPLVVTELDYARALAAPRDPEAGCPPMQLQTGAAR